MSREKRRTMWKGMMGLGLVAAAATILVLSAGVASAKKPPKPPPDPEPGLTYSLVDLGTLGGTLSEASAINASGQVVGQSGTSTGEEHAFLWNGVMFDLGTLGGSRSGAGDINDAGQVVGSSSAASGVEHAFLWTAGDGMIDLGALRDDSDPTPDSGAAAINNHGQVVGWAIGPGEYLGWPVKAVIWEVDEDGNVTLTDLGFPDAPGPTVALDINDAGQVVGGFSGSAFLITPVDADGDGHLDWFWDGDGDGTNDLIVELPTLGGRTCEAHAINSLGEVLGWSTDRSGKDHAVVWTVDGAGSVTITDLGRVKGEAHTGVSDINDVPQVVGTGRTGRIYTSGHPETRTAYLWENGTMTKLKDMISDSGGLDTDNQTARGINNSGLIVGASGKSWDSDPGWDHRAYIAIPSSTP